MPFVIRDALVGHQGINVTSDVKQHALGTRVMAVDPVYGEGEFIYALGAASTEVGSWVTINEDDYTTTLLAANAIGKVGVAMSANVDRKSVV